MFTFTAILLVKFLAFSLFDLLSQKMRKSEQVNCEVADDSYDPPVAHLLIFHIRQGNGKYSILVPVFGDRRILVKVDTDVPLGKSPLHRKISKGLAEQLKIPFLSAELLEDEDDEEQMAVDLQDSIKSFLRENDVLYAVNEFLANADDAKATKISILLDNRRDDFETRVISPSFETLQSSSYIIFYNDAVFSENDFSGLKKVGRGGKTNEIDTHGRHGLGALAFYYFTDVRTTIALA